MEHLVSIIVPAYNLENHIGCCIESILNQTYKKLQVIIVDDGSMDKTTSIINEYAKKDKRIVPIYKENGGVSSARMAGIVVASGDYIGFVDGDDCVEPEMFECLLNNAVRYQADISHCGYKRVFPDGHVDYYYNTGRIIKQNQKTGLKDLLSGVFVEPGLWNKLYKKELLHNLVYSNVMDTKIKINEDLLMNYYLFQQAKNSIYQDICPYCYILRKNSASTSKLNEHKLKDPIKVLRILYEENYNNPELRNIVENRLIHNLINVAVMPLRNQKELIFSYRKTIRTELRGRVPKILVSNGYGARLKAQALWAAVWPMSYYLVHFVYSRLKGLDKKYDVT